VQWRSHGGAGRDPGLARNFFSSPSLNNDIYNFSLSSKAIKILAPLNFIFYFATECVHAATFSKINKIQKLIAQKIMKN
jgi:hypothetical protein